MRIFDIEFRKYAVTLIPPFLRGKVFITIVLAFVSPIIELYLQFLSNRKLNLIRVNFNYQKFSLQRRLNDLFDPIERRIEIVKAVQYEGIYLYTEAEDDIHRSKTKWLSDNPIYLRSESELYSEYDFIVKIPNTGINMHQLRAEIEYYMLQSKNYTIEII